METTTKYIKKDWKAEAIARGKTNRKLRSEIKRQKERAEKWRSRCYELKRSSELTKVKNHHYPLELMWIGILMHIDYNISLRGVSKSLCKLSELFGLSISYISPTTIRNWCLKFGFHCLLRPLKSGEYVLILDESVEIGKEHLMALLAVPIENSNPITALCLEDTMVLDLKVQSSWKGDKIAELINYQKAKGLEFVYGISDGGHTLKKALSKCSIPWISDCTHEIANKTKALFKNDDIFNGFIKKINALRAKWIMSKNNFYVPPGLRSKSRFHQLFAVHKWANFIFQNWTDIPKDAQQELQFVKQNTDLVRIMEQFYFLINVFAGIFKNVGIQKNSLAQWEKVKNDFFEKNQVDQKVKSFIEGMSTYLQNQFVKFEQDAQDMQILCCSDIIESSFGKYKNKGGMKIITEDVLKIAAYSDKKQIEEVKIAMEQTKIVQIQKWKEENTTVSKLALLKRAKKKSAA